MTVDPDIIHGCRSGKRWAQNRLYKAYSGSMLGLCLRYSADLSEAEDMLQEGFIKVFSNITKLKNDESIGPWIRKIMVNTAITHVTRKRVRFEAIGDDLADETAEEPEQDYLSPVKPDVVLQIIQELPEGYRMVLNLYVFEGFSHREISEALQISENTSKTQLFKARKAIKKKLEGLINKNINLVENETRT